jgi:hypothetical protein
MEGSYVRDYRGMGVCMVGTVGYLAGSKHVGRKGSVVTGWERQRGGDKDGEGVDKKGQKKIWGKTMDCSTRKLEIVMRVKIGIRK